MWKSLALWPDTSLVRSSDDIHPSKEHAESACKMLKQEGMGDEKKIFPMQVFVEDPNGNVAIFD